MSEASRVLSAEMLEEFRHFSQSQTEFAARLEGQVVNNVLEVWSGTIPAEGFVSREYSAAAGGIQVTNLGVAANIVTVSSSSPGAAGVPTGTGTYLVIGQQTRTIALASRAFTLYGTAGDRIAFEVFTCAPRPTTS